MFIENYSFLYTNLSLEMLFNFIDHFVYNICMSYD